MSGNFFKGLFFFWQGLRYLSLPELRRYIIWPIIINLILFIIIFGGIGWVLLHYFTGWLSGYPHWVLLLLGWLLGILYILAVLFVGIFTFTLSTNIIASPFYGLLAEQTEKIISGKTDNLPFSLFKILKREIKKLLYFIPLFLLCLLFFIIPPLWPFLPFLIFFPLAWFIAVQYIDYCPDNQGIEFKAAIRNLKQQHLLTAVGFGSVVSIAMSIPFLNIFVPPAAVIGGTLLWLEVNKPIQ